MFSFESGKPIAVINVERYNKEILFIKTEDDKCCGGCTYKCKDYPCCEDC